MQTLPIPFSKSTAIALGFLLVLLLAGQFKAALFLVVGWSLGGDGSVFRSAYAQMRGRLKSSPAKG